jgi:hypothetical protein
LGGVSKRAIKKTASLRSKHGESWEGNTGFRTIIRWLVTE